MKTHDKFNRKKLSHASHRSEVNHHSHTICRTKYIYIYIVDRIYDFKLNKFQNLLTNCDKSCFLRFVFPDS